MLVSSAIISVVSHGLRDLKISQATLARAFADQHAEAVLDSAGHHLTLHLDTDDLTFQAETELATRRNAQATPNLHRNDNLTFV